MTGYVARAVPWPLVATGCAVVAGLMGLVAAWPFVLWPLQGTAVGVLAGTVAWSMDEPAAAVVDTLPRSLRWRTAARASTVPLVVGVWATSLVLMRARIPEHLALFLLQGVGAACLALAVTAWRRSRGEPEPGRPFAALVVPVATALALARPFVGRLPVFPVWPDDRWVLSQTLWSVVTAGSLAVLVAALRPASFLCGWRSGGSGPPSRSAALPCPPGARR
jgi:hypothetical protein